MGSATQTIDVILAEEDYMRRVARRLTRSEADADDLLQETLLRAFRASNRFTPGTNVRAWMATIMRRVFLTQSCRARRHHESSETDVGGGIDQRPQPARPLGVDVGRLREHVTDSMWRALQSVPEHYRVAFLLHTVAELRCDEIGERLGIAEGTAMSRCHRARRRLQELLRPNIGPTRLQKPRPRRAGRSAA
jgi:RNA polymerase sigma-70 factor (ECF subfamily)